MLSAVSSIGPEGVEPSYGPYKEPALTVELRAVRSSESFTSVGPEGIEPSLARLKVCCAAFTPRPRNQSESGVSNVACSFRISFANGQSLANLEWPEVESNHRCRLIRAICFRYNTGPQNRGGQNRTALSRAPKARGSPLPFTPQDRLES